MTGLKGAFVLLILCTFIGLGLAVWTSIETSQREGPAPMRDPQPIAAPE